MAAPLGFKDFTTGEVLTANDVDGYLMQGIWVFANATARDAAVTSPQEGNAGYLKDTDVIMVYTGSTWATQSASNPISANIVDAKGDLIAGTAADTVARLAVGTNGQVLTADSTAATGLAWATSAAGGMTLLSTTTLSGASTTISSISGSYNKLVAYIYGATNAAGNYEITIQANGSANLAYAFITQNIINIYNTDKITNGDIKFGATSTQTGVNSTMLEIENYAQTSAYKPFQWSGYATTSAGDLGFATIGGIKTNSAISSLKFITSASTFNAGTVLLYGVK